MKKPHTIDHEKKQAMVDKLNYHMLISIKIISIRLYLLKLYLLDFVYTLCSTYFEGYNNMYSNSNLQTTVTL